MEPQTPQILVSQYVFPEALTPLRDAGFTVDARPNDEPLPPDQLRAAAAGATSQPSEQAATSQPSSRVTRGLMCLLTDRIDREFLAAAPDLGVVANVAVGYDNVDVGAATELGVLVTNTPGVLTEATADLAMALLLAAARRIPEGDAFLRGGHYHHWKLAQEQLGLDVAGQTLGIYGFGKIGQALARRARGGFGMEILYHGRRRLPEEREQELGVSWVGFEELLALSDFVSVNAPLTPDTRHAFDAATLARMKPTAVLVNTARGPLVDEAALAQALKDGTIAGAGIDVYEHEPQVHPELLAQHERVVLLPHLGSATRSTRRRMADIAVANLLEALAGRRPPNLVNPDVLDRAERRLGGSPEVV